ncbi:TPA: hypothetical protein M4L12_002882 [Enterococcus faecium]|nr:hypothetical protein [Enterococcus faecium]
MVKTLYSILHRSLDLTKISNISYYDNFDDVNYDLQERYNDLIEELEERGE